MAAGHGTRSYLNNGGPGPGVNVATNQTNVATGITFGINSDMRLNLVVDVVVGQCAVIGTTNVGLRNGNGFGLWTNTKTAAVSASTDKTISSVTAGTGTLTSNSHGYTAGQLVTINSSGAVPGGLFAGGKYFVTNPTTNTFQLSASYNGPAITSFLDAGSGTIKTTAAAVVTLAFNAQTAGDVQYLPLRPQAEIIATTANGDTIQIIDVRVAHLY